MTREADIRNLQVITALDSLSYGVVYPFLSTYILKSGGDHVSVGIMAMGNVIGELLSEDVTKIFTHLHGRRYALFFILNTAIVTHLMMAVSCSHWFTILVRILFSITNQSQNLCQELLLDKAQNDEERHKLNRKYSILSGSGYIFGPILSGCIFDSGFGYTLVLAAFLSLFNVMLLMEVSKGTIDINPEHTDKSVLEKASLKVSENYQEFKNCDPKKHWDMLAIKYLFSGSIIIFCSKFTQIIRYNYNAQSVTMGYTCAYINIMVFAATYYAAIAKSVTQNQSLFSKVEVSFLLISVLMLLACYAPNYELYMVLLVPIIFLRTFITSLWSDLFSERKNDALSKLNNSASVVAGLTTPILFGILCNRIAHNAVILFSCVPMFFCWVILRWYSKHLKYDDVITENRKDL